MAVHLFMHFHLFIIWQQITTQDGLIYLKFYALCLTNPPSQCTLRAFSPQVKQLGHETNHSFPSSSKVKNEWIYTSSPLYFFMVCRRSTLPSPMWTSWVVLGGKRNVCVLYLGKTFTYVNFKVFALVWMRYQFCCDVLHCQKLCGFQHLKSV